MYEPPCSRKCANVMGWVSRVNSDLENISAVLTWQSGITTEIPRGSSQLNPGSNSHPRLPAQAALPRTNTGTSAQAAIPAWQGLQMKRGLP